MAAFYLPSQIRTNLIIIIISISVHKVLPASLNLNTANEKQPQLTRLDFESCNCLPVTINCEVTISSEILSGFKCQTDHHYCCSVSKKNTTASINNFDSTQIGDIGSTNQTEIKKPKVRITIPTPTESATSLFYPTVPKRSDKIDYRCRCKLIKSCPEDYRDYSFAFGYNCTTEQVKCCEPVPVPKHIRKPNTKNDTKNSFVGAGRLINVFQNNDKATDNCFCLPKSKCNTRVDQIMNHRVTVCPGNLTQCCGVASVVDKNDYDEDDPVESDHNDSLEKLDDNSGPATAIQEAHHEPIQLPLDKIPQFPTSAAEDLTTSTLPPPQLPIQYFSPVENHNYYKNHNGYVYSPIVPTTQRKQRPSHYYTGSAPWASKYGNSYLINNNGRGFIETGRASPPSSSPSFFSGLASLIG